MYCHLDDLYEEIKSFLYIKDISDLFKFKINLKKYFNDENENEFNNFIKLKKLFILINLTIQKIKNILQNFYNKNNDLLQHFNNFKINLSKIHNNFTNAIYLPSHLNEKKKQLLKYSYSDIYIDLLWHDIYLNHIDNDTYDKLYTYLKNNNI